MNPYAIQELQLQSDGVYGVGCAVVPVNGIQLGSVGAVTDYDTIRVGGGTYSVNQIVDKSIRANKDTKLYKGSRTNSEVIGIVKAGDIIGRVYSYLRPDQTTDGKSWLMFEKTYNNFYYVQNEAANTSDLKDQGALTVKEEVKKEEIEKFKEESPVEYYIKKYATKVIIGIGLIVLASTVGRTLVTEGIKKIGSKKSEPTPTPALAGVKKKKRATKRKK